MHVSHYEVWPEMHGSMQPFHQVPQAILCTMPCYALLFQSTTCRLLAADVSQKSALPAAGYHAASQPARAEVAPFLRGLSAWFRGCRCQKRRCMICCPM